MKWAAVVFETFCQKGNICRFLLAYHIIESILLGALAFGTYHVVMFISPGLISWMIFALLFSF